MLTTSQLLAFDPALWNAWADWARTRAKTSREIQTRLEDDAKKVEQAWPDPVGRMAAAQLRQQAASQGELATAYDDGACVIEDAANNICRLRDQMKDIKTYVDGSQYLEGPAEDGTVTSTYQFSFGDLAEYFHWQTLADQTTLRAQNTLAEATGYDLQAEIALLALLGLDLPPVNDGPIDLTDEGIARQARLNEQGQFGDCVTLSFLASLGQNNPDFIRKHMKWDPATGTYLVTLYDDNGNPVVQRVDPNSIPDPNSNTAGTGKPSWMSIYEQAIEQQYGDIENGQGIDTVSRRITGEGASESPSNIDHVRAGLAQDPPAVVTAFTPGGEPQPDDVDPAKRLVPGHAYTVRGIDADGNVILQNPWGPAGGYGADGKYYPGEVHLTPEEYERWLGNDSVRSTPR